MNLAPSTSTLIGALAASLALCGPVLAQKADDHAAHHAPAATAAASDLTDGEVRKVDKDAAKLTLRHGPIASLDMPAMTMVYAVKDKDRPLLDTLKAGDKLRFRANNEAGKLTLTEIQVAR